LLHVIAGYLIFLSFGFSIYALIAGTIGAFFSVLFLIGTQLFRSNKLLKIVFAIVLPLLFIGVVNNDFTVKKQWVEQIDESSYTVSFDLFNGEHHVPIQVVEGQTVAFTIHILNLNGGGHGYHVLDPKGKYAVTKEGNDGKMNFEAEQTGVYEIVIKGDGLRGEINVDWEVSEN
jgi:hypothetical protein